MTHKQFIEQVKKELEANYNGIDNLCEKGNTGCYCELKPWLEKKLTQAIEETLDETIKTIKDIDPTTSALFYIENMRKELVKKSKSSPPKPDHECQ